MIRIILLSVDMVRVVTPRVITPLKTQEKQVILSNEMSPFVSNFFHFRNPSFHSFHAPVL